MTQMEKGKLHSRFLIGRTSEGRRTKRGEPRGRKVGGPRSQILWPRGAHHLGPWAPRRSGLFSTTPSRRKMNALIFPSSSEASAAKLLIPSEGDQILLLRSSGEGGNHRHHHHLSSLAWEEASISSSPSRPAPSPSPSP